MKITFVGTFDRTVFNLDERIEGLINNYSSPVSALARDTQSYNVVDDLFEFKIKYEKNKIDKIVIRKLNPDAKPVMRWINGFGDEAGNIYPYQFWIEKDGIKFLELDTSFVEKFLKDNHITINDFRKENKDKWTQALIESFVNKS